METFETRRAKFLVKQIRGGLDTNMMEEEIEMTVETKQKIRNMEENH